MMAQCPTNVHKYVEPGSVESHVQKTILVNVYPKGKPDKAIRAYCTVDDQSNRTLARSELFDQLDVQCDETNYLLSSCAGQTTAHGRKTSGITVESIDGSMKLYVPTILECDQIPNIREEIPTPEITYYHDHLQDVYIPPLESTEILLLMG